MEGKIIIVIIGAKRDISKGNVKNGRGIKRFLKNHKEKQLKIRGVRGSIP